MARCFRVAELGERDQAEDVTIALVGRNLSHDDHVCVLKDLVRRRPTAADRPGVRRRRPCSSSGGTPTGT
jgi:hypothetical protein